MPLFRKKIPKAELVIYGNDLLQEFASAVANSTVAESLKYEAEQNEAQALQNIASVGASNDMYVTPRDIPPEQQAYIAKASLDAHMQKTQAIQVAAYNDQQVHIAELHVKEKYRGLKVTVMVAITDPWPVDTCWRDSYGRYHINEHGPKKVTGIIEDIDLQKNYIILRPTKAFRTINNTIKFHRIYIVLPATLQPLVTLRFS